MNIEDYPKIYARRCTGCDKIDGCVKIKNKAKYYCKPCFDTKTQYKYEDCEK